MKKLINIQNELKAPKGQFNNFGKYKYRSCEDILEALKPLLANYECTLTITDEIKKIGGYLYCEAEATITDGETYASVRAQAGIDPNKKGMDIAQTFGASSSYARKYALNGLFLIDDTKDADTQDNSKKEPVVKTPPAELEKEVLAVVGKIASLEKLEAYFHEVKDKIKEYKTLVNVIATKKVLLKKESALK